MADDGSDLVSQIQIIGAAEAAAQLQSFADKGADALDKVGKAAKQSSDQVSKSSDVVAKSVGDQTKALEAAAKVDFAGPTVSQLSRAEAAGRAFGKSLQTTVKDVGAFVARVGTLGLAAGVAAVGVAAAAGKIAKGLGSNTDAFADNAKAQQNANNETLQTKVATINLASSMRQLYSQWANGEITYEQFSAAARQQRQQFVEQQKVARDVAFETESVRLANERLQKTVEDRKAFVALVDTFGGPLTGSLIAFGNQVNQTRSQLVTAFGPALATIFDAIGNTLNKNSGAFSKFVDESSAKLSAFATSNAPAIEQAITSIAQGAQSVISGLIAALPEITRVFNDSIVPAIKSFVGYLRSVTGFINSVFGTNFTVGFIVAAAAVLRLVGGFKLAFSILKSLSIASYLFYLRFGLIGIAVALVVAGLVLLYKAIDWEKLKARAQAALDYIINTFKAAPSTIGGAFSALVTIIGAAFKLAADYVVNLWTTYVIPFFFNTLPTAIFNAFELLRVTVNGWVDAAIAYITTQWNSIVAYFAGILASIGTFFSNLWASVSAGVSQAVQFVVNTFNSLIAFFASLPGIIGAFFVSIGTAIQTAFQDAIKFVQGLFNDFVTYAKGKLQPVIDLINKIKAALPGGGAAGGPAPTVSAATGGHITGPGTGTSDSILARLSNNEYVVKARAVAKYGVNFMHAVNSGRLDLSKLRGFAVGGLVGGPAPSFAFAGGADNAGKGNTINLSLFGEQFDGLQADDDIARRLSRLSVERDTRAAGRRPSWSKP